jgi:poly(A) polymerase
VHYGDEIIEVATFRAAQAPDELDDEDHREIDDQRVTDSSGRLLRDNIYGSIDDDVWRRDFTANALYYNIEDFSIWDYVGGVGDVRDKVLRLIGDPETRFREDPVRLLRAVRFAGKLGFSVHPDTRAPMGKLAPLLAGVPAARLFDECNKMFLSGHGLDTFRLLQEFDLLQHLLPGLAAHLQDYPESPARQVLELGLRGTDERVAAGKPVSPTFLFAVLLYGPIAAAADEHIADGASEVQALAVACDEVIGEQLRRVAVPKRFTLPLRELLALQPRFRRRDGRKALALLHHPRFRGAYDLLLLRASAGLEPQELADWWTEIQTLPGEQRVERVESAPVTEEAEAVGVDGAAAAPQRRRRRRRRRGPAPNPA